MVIPPIMMVVLVGLSGSGKSSLVNLMYSVLGRSGLIPFSQTSNESSRYTTMYLEEHNVLRSLRSGFCIYDTRGLDVNQMKEGLDEVSEWMNNGVRHYQLCLRPGDDVFRREALVTPMMGNARFGTRQVNCALVVANMAQICNGVQSGDLKPLEATKDLFHCPALRKSSESPILILTHGDELSPEERIIGRLKISEYLGVAETTGLYDIPCLTEQGILPEESDPVTAYALAEAVYRALLQADRAHLPKKKLRDRVSLVLSWFMCSIGSFFALLAYFFSKLGRNNKLKI
ncbi:hypothetical protein EUGRSUZ_H04024 [Eucalyptus grandis]|uniref:Uncharacterized protein n=2 Tax=Eucalyptus grandis TaxID=71139 RepID=A0ACC3JXX9_EUCGR|nr:hypothetical protein EUGRSUZ_H04024 [Eucalyptus grandis]